MQRKKIVFYGAAVLFALACIGAVSSSDFGGAVGCLVVAAVFVFLARRNKAASTAPAAVQPEAAPVVKPAAEKPEFLFEQIKVAGVTFKNGRKSRQTILRAIKFRDEPYADGLELGLTYYEYEGKPAYNVTVNDEVIGSVPADKVQYIDELMSAGKIVAVTYINVYGGGTDKGGKPISYGAEITIKIKNS